MPKYVFDNAGQQTSSRFSAIEQIFDAGSFRELDRLGIRPGMRCLEVGGGSGSVARYLAQKVGAEGRVLITDIDPRHLEGIDAPNIEVRQHDIVNDDLEEDHFDVAHTRLVLLHLPQRERAIARIIRALKRGGWVLFEEFDSASMKPDPSVSPSETLLPLMEALWATMASEGVDLRFGRLLPAVLERNGLTRVEAEGRTFLWRGGSAWADLMRANVTQMHDKLIASGNLTEAQYQADIVRLDDPSVMWPSSVMWAVRGQRP